MLTGEDLNKQNGAENSAINLDASSLGGTTTGFSLMSGLFAAGAGSEYLQTASKILKDLLVKFELDKKGFRIIPCDKDIVSTAYSSIIIGKTIKVENKDMFLYYSLVLEATGAKTPSVDDVVNEINFAAQNQKHPKIFWADNSVDAVYHKNVKAYMSNELGDIQKSHIDGVVIPANSSLNLEALLSTLLGSAADNLNITEYQMVTKSEINVASACKPGTQYVVETSMPLNNTITNKVGKPVAADVVLTLLQKDIRTDDTKLQSLNQSGGSRVLGSVAVKIEWVPVKVEILVNQGAQTMFQTAKVPAIRIKPHIIITNINCNEPTLGMTMLMIRTAAVMIDEEMWKKIAMQSETYPAMNIFSNIEMSDKGVGSNLSKDFKALSDAEKLKIVDRMSESAYPSISIDVEKFGPTTFALSAFMYSANVNGVNGAAAKRDVYEALEKLTSGKFAASKALYQPFMSYSELPLGTFASKSGEDDLRKFDTSFIAALPNATVEKVSQFMHDSSPESFTGKQPLVATIRNIAAETSSAEIYGRYYRLTFNRTFIEDLATAINEDGLVLNYDKLIKTTLKFKLTDLALFTNSSITSLNGQAAFNNVSTFNDVRLNSFMGGLR